MSFMPLSGCTFLAQRLSTAIDHLHLHNFACQSILPSLHCQTLSWVDSLEHLHLYISTCQQVLAHLHCQDRNRRYSLDNFCPSNIKTWTEDIRLTTFACTTSLAKQRVHSPSANLELYTTTWSHALAQLHLPTNTRTPPIGNLELKTFTWQDALDNFRPWTCTSFSPCQKTHNFGMRHPAAYSPWQPHMEDVHLQTFPWHSWLWFIYADCTHSQKDPLATTRLGVRRAWSPHVPGNKQNPATHTHTHTRTHTHTHAHTHAHTRTHAHTHIHTHIHTGARVTRCPQRDARQTKSAFHRRFGRSTRASSAQWVRNKTPWWWWWWWWWW